jgi:hypothetical protein
MPDRNKHSSLLRIIVDNVWKMFSNIGLLRSTEGNKILFRTRIHKWRYDTQHNDIQDNDTQRNDIQNSSK